MTAATLAGILTLVAVVMFTSAAWAAGMSAFLWRAWRGHRLLLVIHPLMWLAAGLVALLMAYVLAGVDA